jgi:enterochelin esterase-like enzyme
MKRTPALWILLVCSVVAAGQSLPFTEWKQLASRGGKGFEDAAAKAFRAEDIVRGSTVVAEGENFLLLWKETTKVAAPLRYRLNEDAPLAMRKVSGTPWWWATQKVAVRRTHNVQYMAGDKAMGGRMDVIAYGPDAYEKPGVPKGKLSEKRVHVSRIYDGMKSDYWVYVPAQYNAAQPVAVMVWQDGEVLVPREGASRAQIVFDNLTHEKKIPVMIHVLISPGLQGEKRMRSILYDTVSDRYARFLEEEILAEMGKEWKLRADGYSRALAGDSSGGICAFNGAWQRPELFSRVLSRIGSFTSIQWKPGDLDGGNIFPFLIRKSPKRNLRVWLQDGANDLENSHGSWPMQNIAMANSLKMMQYDFHFTWGNGSHSRNGGHAELAEELQWLWRGYDPAQTTETFQQDPAEKDKPFFRVANLNR